METLNNTIERYFKGLDADSFICISDIVTDECAKLPIEEQQDEMCMEVTLQLPTLQTTNDKILEKDYDICNCIEKDTYVCILVMLLTEGFKFEFLIRCFECLMIYTIIYNVIILYITNYAFLITNGRAPPVRLEGFT